MNTRFKGQVAMITGASKGIGAAIARAFGREGARVAILDVDAPNAKMVSDEVRRLGGEPLFVTTDVTSATQIKNAVEQILTQWKRVDVLVNNAGGFSVMRRTEDIPDTEWDTIVRFNLTSTFLCSKAVIPVMRRQHGGRIINLASIVGRAGAVDVTSHYAAAKAGVIGFTHQLAREVGPDGITVNAVAPGTVTTERDRSLRNPDEQKAVAATIPLRRVGEPDEIADAVLFLASNAARYITGVALDVNGGQVMV